VFGADLSKRWWDRKMTSWQTGWQTGQQKTPWHSHANGRKNSFIYSHGWTDKMALWHGTAEISSRTYWVFSPSIPKILFYVCMWYSMVWLSSKTHRNIQNPPKSARNVSNWMRNTVKLPKVHWCVVKLMRRLRSQLANTTLDRDDLTVVFLVLDDSLW